MKSIILGALRFLLVTLAIVVLTTLTIDATNTFNTSQSALSIFARNATEASCPDGMTEIKGSNERVCIDEFEASAGDSCIFLHPLNVNETSSNASDADCVHESMASVIPWTHVAMPQAAEICARSGKRLPTSEEWFKAAQGTPDNKQVCNTHDNLRTTGNNDHCVSGVGASDMIGNVWEWVSDTVTDGHLGDAILPSSGYVSMVNQTGTPIQSTSAPQSVYNNDYIWSSNKGTFITMRGGFHGSQGDAGIYSVHAILQHSFESAAVGFRCAITL